ncbi:MAG TPA: FecR domain-containing protein, partial [Chthoniobacteraceae bacterium]
MASPHLRLVVVWLLLFSTVGQAWGQEPAAGAALIEAENDVTTRRGGTAWQKGEPTSPLAVGDKVKTGKRSRAAVRLTDLSVMRMDQLTVFEVGAAAAQTGQSSIDIQQGGAYIFSRERGPEMRINTPAANGALRGTQLVVRVTEDAKTFMTVFEGEVDLSNAQGSVTLATGEQGEVEVGKAPKKTAVINAVNILQWALYYPAVLNPAELGMTAAEERRVAASLAAYREGDLLGALEKYPDGQPFSSGGRLYYAGVLLAVGRVDDAMRAISSIPADAAGRQALEEMTAAVKFQEVPASKEPQTASGWVARSYYTQSRSQLEPAREAARRATEVAPDFGYGWVRLAEMEFSFGRTRQALAALEKGLALTPRN